MKLRLATVTYRQPGNLENTYRSIVENSPLRGDDVVIINNHSEFEFTGDAHVVHNSARRDESLGNLARSWNECLQWTFGSSAMPECDWVGLLQGDVVLEPGWFETLQSIIDTGLSFICCGPGDQALFLSIDAFRAIGWWDERFSGIGYQEFDYLLRAYLTLGRSASIEGHWKSLIWNWEPAKLIHREPWDSSGHSMRLNPMLLHHLRSKWGVDVVNHLEFFGNNEEQVANWTRFMDEHFGDESSRRDGNWRNPLPKEYNWYPHFFAGDSRDYSHLYEGFVQL